MNSRAYFFSFFFFFVEGRQKGIRREEKQEILSPSSYRCSVVAEDDKRDDLSLVTKRP